MDSSDGFMIIFVIVEFFLVDFCWDVKKSFFEDLWKVEEKCDSLYMLGFKNMMMNDRVLVFEMVCICVWVVVWYFCKVFMM